METAPSTLPLALKILPKRAPNIATTLIEIKTTEVPSGTSRIAAQKTNGMERYKIQSGYSSRDLRAKTERAGFHILRVSSFVSLLLPLMLYSRRRRTRTTQTATTALSVAPVVDTMRDNVMRVELLTIRMGLSFPLGGSLLLVARKR